MSVRYALIVLALTAEDEVKDALLRQAPCRVFLALPPPIPRQPDEEPPPPA